MGWAHSQGSPLELMLTLPMENQTQGQNELFYSSQPVVKDTLKTLIEKFPGRAEEDRRNAGVLAPAVVNWGKVPSRCSWRGTEAWWGIAGCSCCASPCQGLLGAPVLLQPAGKGAAPPGEAGEQPGWMSSLGRALPGMDHECESVCTAKPCACRNPQGAVLL